MTLRLSCADYSWPLLEHRTALRLIRDLGFDAVDIGLFWGATHVRPEEVVTDPRRWAGIVSERTESSGLVIADVFLTPGPDLATRAPNHPDATVREEARALMRAAAEFAAGVGSPGVTVLPGVTFGDEDLGRALERSAAELSAWVEIAGERGLELSFEPHNLGVCDTPDRTLSLLQATPGLRTTLDPSHFAYAGFDAEAMLPLVPSSRHLQVRPARESVMQSRVVESTIDLGLLLDALTKGGYDGYVATEFVWIEGWDCNRVDNLSETILLRDLIRSLL